jgi:hypothetical protein
VHEVAVFLLIGAARTLVGALGLSVLTVLLYWLLEPEAFGDGQFVTVFIFTMPFAAGIDSRNRQGQSFTL